MLIGVPKEVKPSEYRVGLVPHSVQELVVNGHQVFVETEAGAGINCTDEMYEKAGAKVVSNAREVYLQAELIIKVKEPQPSEFSLIKENQILFTYLHLAPNLRLTEALLANKCTAIAYETVTDDHGRLPLLAPMSAVAGRLAIQAGANALEKTRGGRGILLGGIPGVERGTVVVIGGGVVGSNALRMAVGKEAQVVVLDKNIHRLQQLDSEFGAKISTVYATNAAIENWTLEADLIIGAVLIPGHTAPRLIDREILSRMHRNAVMVDVSIDQGGCFATSKPTTHDNPTYVVDGVIHYCVTNMPGAVPRTATFALNNATLPFILKIANQGYKGALLGDKNLLNGLNIHKGMVTYRAVASALNMEYLPPEEALSNF